MIVVERQSPQVAKLAGRNLPPGNARRLNGGNPRTALARLCGKPLRVRQMPDATFFNGGNPRTEVAPEGNPPAALVSPPTALAPDNG
ncbi:hypothetical protein DP113_26320 [Brasilonema octagenarum UFV-E1]|nr:hypothetical protein DP113_26320 [Brasilonema octagenarum UFV-E1]